MLRQRPSQAGFAPWRGLTAHVLALLALCLAAPPLMAQSYGRAPPEGIAKVELLPGWREGKHQMAALKITLMPGWKTYWRAPGEAGIPPVLKWSDSDNLAGVQFAWPTPIVFEANGMQSIGYRDEVIFPMILLPRRPDQPIRLSAVLDLGVCRDVCVPVSTRVEAEIPPGGKPDPRIRAALAAQPLTAAEAGVRKVTCVAEPIRDGLRVTASLDMPLQGRGEVVVVEAGVPGVWASDADSSRAGGVLTAAADLVPPEARPFALDRSKLRITVIAGGRAVDIQGCPGG